MAPKRKKRTNAEDGMKLVQQCPLCETVYEPLEIKVLNETDNKHLDHVTCAKCKHSEAALITHNPNGVSSLGLITDASSDDILRFVEVDAVDFDDVISWHEASLHGEITKETFLN